MTLGRVVRAVLAVSTLAPGAAAAGEHGLDLDLGWASAYLWRGTNVFQSDSQLDQHMLLAPALTWSVGDTGLWLGYWGAFQLTGPNRAQLVDEGLGAEADLLAGYALDLSERTWASVAVTAYLYPLADGFPAYLEPGLTVGWSGPVDLQLMTSYFHGFGTDLADFRHVYLNPALSWELDLTERVGLTLGLGLGVKLFTTAWSTDNLFDALVTAGVPIDLGSGLELVPGAQLAWSTFDDSAFVDGLSAAGTLALGYSL